MAEKPAVVCVVWEDASNANLGAWTDNKDIRYIAKIITSVGFLLYEGDDGIALAAAWSEDIVSVPDNIPRGMIKSITYLEPVRQRRGKK